MSRRLLVILTIVGLAVGACRGADSDVPSTSVTASNPEVTSPNYTGPIADLPPEDRMAASFALFRQGLPAKDLVDQLGGALEAEIDDPTAGDGPGWFTISESLQEQYTRMMAVGGEPAIPEIRRRMAASGGTARLWYLVALGYAGDDTIDAELVSALNADPTPPVAMHLMELVGIRSLTEAVPALTEFLLNDDIWFNSHVGGQGPIFPLRDNAAGALRHLGYVVYSDPDQPSVYAVMEP